MVRTRSVGVVSLLAVWLAHFGPPDVVQAAKPILDAAQVKVALAARTPQEKRYVDDVVQQVTEKRLPLKTFYIAFLHAKSRPEHRVQHFQKALIQLTKTTTTGRSHHRQPTRGSRFFRGGGFF